MARSSSITVKINGDPSNLSKALGQASGDLDGFGSKVGKLAKGAGLALAGLGVGAVALAPQILSAGAQIEALGNKSATVFEGSLGDVQAWAKANAGALGLTTQELVGTAAGFADLLKPMGFTADQAAEMSKQTLDLSGALSAWTGGTQSAAEVSDVLAKAMLGERDGLKALGISISEADVSARLLAKGQDKLAGAALEQAKALVTQELILEKSTDAQKAWADGSMDSIKAQNEAKASLNGLKETLIMAVYPAFQGLLPIVSSATAWLGDNLPAAIEMAKGLLSAIGDVVMFVADNFEFFAPILIGVATAILVSSVPAFIAQASAAALAAGAMLAAAAPFIAIGAAIAAVGVALVYAYENWDWFRDAVDAVKDWIVGTLWPALQTAFAGILTGIRAAADGARWAIDNVFAPAFASAAAAVRTASDIIGPLVGGIGSAIGLAWDVVKWAVDNVYLPAWDLIVGAVETAYDLIEPVLDSIGGLFGAMADVAAGAFKGVIDTLKKAWNAIAGLWNSGPGAISFSVGIPGVGDVGFDVPNLPVLHSGGWVPGNGDVPIMAQSGEFVLSRDNVEDILRGGGARTYNVYVSDGRSVLQELQLVDALYGAAA